jgi:hypothetical protein
VPDPNPKLTKGCCFLPRQRDGTDRYFGVIYQTFGGISRAFSYEMWFAAAISFTAAKNVVREEARPGSRFASSKRRGDCFTMTFKSSVLSRAFKSKSAVMEAALYSSGTSGPFNGRTVQDIIFLPASAGGC